MLRCALRCWFVYLFVGLCFGCAPREPAAEQPKPAAAPASRTNATETVARPTTQAATASASPASGSPRGFGEPLASDRAGDLDIAEVLSAPERYAAEPVTVHGVVTAVCQQRGCWLEVAASDGPNARGCRVVSEHHDWFVPHDAAGDLARVHGRLDVRTISAEQVAHMESEGGRFPDKQADGSAREIRVIASGVELARK